MSACISRIRRVVAALIYSRANERSEIRADSASGGCTAGEEERPRRSALQRAEAAHLPVIRSETVRCFADPRIVTSLVYRIVPRSGAYCPWIVYT